MDSLIFTVLFFMATYRLTKFIAQDEFPPMWNLRQWVLRRWPGDSWQSYLAECMWCVSTYVAGALVLITFPFVHLDPWWLLIPAASAFTGLVSELMDRDNDD